MQSAQGVYSFIDSARYNRFIAVIRNGAWEVDVDGKKFPIDKNDFSFHDGSRKISFDCAYITIHGTPGENGLLQGYFDMIGIPYTCCGVLAAALTFNKFTCNHYLKAYGIKTAESLLLRKGQQISNTDVIEKIGLPCFVKPNAGGSSLGATKVTQENEIQPAFATAFAEGDEVIAEQFIAGTEVTCGCYQTAERQVVFPITEVISKNDFFDYEAKYNASKAEEITPARIPDELANRIQQITQAIYNILNCRGIIRIDYILAESGIFLLEVNTTPGMTATSFIPQQVKAAGLSMKTVMTDVIEESIHLKCR
jgi:D-alanine-D-alanine ligase